MQYYYIHVTFWQEDILCRKLSIIYRHTTEDLTQFVRRIVSCHKGIKQLVVSKLKCAPVFCGLRTDNVLNDRFLCFSHGVNDNCSF